MIFAWISRGIGLLAQLVLTRTLTQMLGVEGYGAYTYIFALVALGNICLLYTSDAADE